MMKRTLSYTTTFAIGVAVCAGVTSAIYGLEMPQRAGLSASKQAVLASLQAIPPVMHRDAADSIIADAAAKVDPAVVDVHTVGRAISEGNPFGNDPFFRMFGGSNVPEQQVHPQGAGSGVIISPDGYILTNNHVVENTEKVTVDVAGKGYIARVVGTDPVSDIAVVKINTHGARLPVAQLGNSDNCRIGDWAIAVGNPLDVGTTVTLGIISAVNRTGLAAEGHPMNAVLQTDAAINPGNSGGALANIDGKVIGINEAIYSPTGSYVGIGFAIPINAARTIAEQLIENGKVVRPYLGVSYAPLKGIPEQARQQIGIAQTTDDGVVVQQVYPGSPAAAAGLKTYDVILEANAQKVTDTNQLSDIIGKLKVGDTLTMLVSRDGSNQIIVARLKDRPSTFGETPQVETNSPQLNESPLGQMPGLP